MSCSLQVFNSKAQILYSLCRYDPNNPHTAYIPPPGPNDMPPTYEDSTKKKNN